jgi:glycosyltransferase involved in cell wall biosynthesis
MRILIATDAWYPQVNGVVQTLVSVGKALERMGVEVSFLTPEGIPSIPLPSYPDIRLALPSSRAIARRIDDFQPDVIHIATEGPIGHRVRAFCRAHGLAFTTSYTTCFPEYIAERLPLPLSVSYAVLRRFHAAATVTMVSTPSLMRELRTRGFGNLGMWGRGVDTAKFRPDLAIDLDLPRPIFLSMGRVAVEKNLEAFLALDLPGSKVVIGEGPQEAELRARYPHVKFLGLLQGRALAAHLAAADVFVFPSRTDTFGVVQLEALACGVPVAAYPVMGPRDVIGGSAVGVMDDDLRAACLAALRISREACRAFALERSWDASARQFIAHVSKAAIATGQRQRAAFALQATAGGT